MAGRPDHGAEEAARHGVKRSDKWPAAREKHLQNEPHCVACKPGAKSRFPLQVHHIFPFHYCVLLGRPDLELDQRNLITLCENERNEPGDNHHLLIGHLDDFKSSNLRVEHDATETFHGMAADVIQADRRWLMERATRLKPLDEMTAQDKEAFKKEMNAHFPMKK